MFSCSSVGKHRKPYTNIRHTNTPVSPSNVTLFKKCHTLYNIKGIVIVLHDTPHTQHHSPHDTGAHVVSTPDLVRIVSIMHVIRWRDSPLSCHIYALFIPFTYQLKRFKGRGIK